MVQARIKLNNLKGQHDLKGIVASLCFGAIISFFLFLGSTSQFTVGLSFLEAASFLFPQFVACSALFYFCYEYLKKHRRTMIYEPIRIQYWMLAFTVLIIVWGINWVIFSPGYWTSDSVSSLRQGLGEEEWQNHHPVIFTALVAIFANLGVAFGNLEAGMAAFTFFTMVFFALCCSYLCGWAYARTRNKYIYSGVILFFVLNLLMAQYSITAWKDIYFSPLLLIFVLRIADLVASRGKLLSKKQFLISLSILALSIMLFRSNGALIAVISFVSITLVYREFWKRCITVIMTVLMLYLFISGPFFACLGIEDNEARETYGVPLQQIAKTIVDEGDISQENKEFFEKIFSFEEIKESYNEYTVDPVKWTDSFDDDFLKNNQLQFIKAWLETFPANIRSYVSAWRDLTLGFWYPSVDNGLIRYSGYQYFEDMSEWRSGVDMSAYTMAPDGSEWISYSFDESSILINVIDKERHLPILNSIYSIGAMVWLLLGVVILKLSLSKCKDVLSLFPLILLWMSLLMATPTFCEFRYILTLHLALPFLAILFIYDIESATECNEIRAEGACS